MCYVSTKKKVETRFVTSAMPRAGSNFFNPKKNLGDDRVFKEVREI
jgi:hypothetical protein